MRPSFALAVPYLMLAVSVAQAEPLRVASATVAGHTLEPSDRLLRFLGLAAGQSYDDQPSLEQHVDEGLRTLGYVKVSAVYTPHPADATVDVALEVRPSQLVRHVAVVGNWPVFDDEIKRRLTLRPGSRLPSVDEMDELLIGQQARVQEFLARDGYFGSEVKIEEEGGGRPEWADLRVRVHLGDSYRLSEVDADGATVFNERELLGAFRSFWPWRWPWGRLRLDALRDDARDVETAYHGRGYPAARVLPEFDPRKDLDKKTHRAKIRAHVTEKAKVELHFVGNHELLEARLREKVTLFSSGSYDEVELQESVKEIHRLYQANGFLDAEVQVRSKHTGGVVEITFEIKEGPQLKVRDVQFYPEPGAAALTVDEKTLYAQIVTRVFPRLGNFGLGQGGYVTTLQLAQDVDKLLAFERARGYPQVKARVEVVRDQAAFGRIGIVAADVAAGIGVGEDLYVRYYIDEGRGEHVDGLTVGFRGEHGRSEAEIRKLVNFSVGDAYAPDALNAARKRVLELYATIGHPYALVDAPTFSWNADHSRVRIGLVVDEGPLVRFGEVLVRGNFKTSEWVIRRDLPFLPGDVFDTRKLSLAERNLQTHTLFNGVRVIPLGLASRKVNPVPILVEIQQERYDDWGTPVLTAGYSTDVGLSLTLGYFWGNVFGGGGQATALLEGAFDLSHISDAPTLDPQDPVYRRLAASLRYVHPHLLWPSFRGEIAAFVRQEYTIRLGPLFSAGLSASLSWVASPSLRLFGRYDYTSSSLQSVDFERLPGRNDGPSSVADVTETGKFTAGVVFDDRLSFDGAKNPLMPISGSLVAGSLALASHVLGGEHEFVVVSGQVQRYQPLGRGVSLIGNARFDWGIPIFGEQALPAVDRFFAGGDVATRGFPTDMLRTEIIRSNVTPGGGMAGFKIIPEGGNIRFLGTVELQFPITELAGFPWVGALFVDAGSVFDSPTLFDAQRDIKVSVGLSLLRLLTPVGPISLEYAYPITQSLAEEEWKMQPWYAHWPGQIHFNWGIPILR